MALLTYREFHLHKVQRKKNELKNPRYHLLGEIQLPRNSLVHYFPEQGTGIGPSQAEALLNNYPKNVFINFINNFEPTIGKGRKVAIQPNILIKSYRAKHYNFSWTKDIGSVYNRDMELIVNSYGLIDEVWVPRPGMFVTYMSAYDKLASLIHNANLETQRGDRHQFFRIELPTYLPGFNDLLIDYDNWLGTFETNKEGEFLPVPQKRALRLTSRENSYWLLDFMALLFGDYKYSLFSKLTKETENNFHLVFTYQGKALILKLSTFKGWLDELTKTVKPVEDGVSIRTQSNKRTNAVKRIYLNLLTLVRNTPIEELEDSSHAKEQPEEIDLVGEKKPTKATEDGIPNWEEEEESILSEIEAEDSIGNSGTLLDVLNSDQGPQQDLTSGETGKGSQDDNKKVKPLDNEVEEDIEIPDLPEVYIEEEEDWTSEVDDSLLEQEEVEATIDLDEDPFDEMDKGIILALEERAKEGALSVAEYKFFEDKANSYKTLKMSTGETLEEFIKIDTNELNELKEDAVIPGEFPTVLDDSMLKSRSTALRRNYVKKFLKKDIVKTVLSIQNAGVAVTDFKHEEINGVEGNYDVFSIQLHPVDGEKSTHPIRIPKVLDDGTFVVDGVRSHLQNQRMEQVIRKIDKDRVLLSTYYPNTLMLTRSRRVVDSLNKFIVKQIVALSKDKASGVSFGRGDVFDDNHKAPRTHSMFSNTFKWVKTKQVTLNFDHNELVKTYPEFKKFNKPNNFLIGVTPSKKPITIDELGMLYVDGEETQDIYSTIGIDQSKMPLENVVVNISGYLYPIGVILCYYFGIDKLLEILKLQTRTVPMGTRPQLSHDEFALSFNDEYLIFNKNEKMATLIFGGMPKLKNISNFSRSDLNDKGIWVPLMGDPRVKAQHFMELKNLYDLFIDPIHKEQLKRLGYSQSLPYLLIEAVELLKTDNAKHEVEINEQRIVGYERFAGHLYRELVKSHRMYRAKGKGRKHKIDLNPEAVITNIITDTSVNLVEEVNPIHEIKDAEELTFGGTGGRSEISVVKRARFLTPSDKGIISEGSKDSSKTGFVSYLTSDPMIDDYRGNIAQGEKPSSTSMASVTGNLTYRSDKDDPKRRAFINSQMSRAVFATNYKAPISRTGYENVLAHRNSDIYSFVAKDEGKVTDVKSEHLEVTYKDGTVELYPLGLRLGKASGELHRHTRITDMKVGDKFKKGEVLGWDEQWFERDPFCPGQVVWKAGLLTRIALVEDQDVFEDSVAFSRRLCEETKTSFIKERSFVFDLSQNLNLLVGKGDDVDLETILCEVEDEHLAAIEGDESDFTLISEINRLGIKTVRSNHHGKIINIEMIYNGVQDEMSESVKTISKKLDSERKKLSKADKRIAESGKLNSSLNVKRPMIGPGRGLITFYVESMDPSGVADKFVIGNQMKATVGAVFEEPIYTQDGQPVDIKFSFKGMFSRMVLSLRDKVGANEFAIQFTKKALEVYRGK